MSEYDDSFAPDNDDIDLSAFDDDFSSAEAPSFEEVPDGKYQVRINSVRLGHSQKGDPMIKWDLIVIAGQHASRHVFKNSVITPAALPFVKGDLKTLGLELAKFSDLAGRLEDLLDVTLEVTKRTRGEYTNVYFNKRIQIAGDTSSPALADDLRF
jgi:Protein of unknown function (DUF669)